MTDQSERSKQMNTQALLDRLEADHPTLTLVGEDGNAFAVMGAAKKALRKWGREHNIEPDEIEVVGKHLINDMQSDDYDHLLQVAMRYFSVK
jgi:hypothetical protein